MTNTAHSSYASADNILAQVISLAAHDPKAFNGAIAKDAVLWDAVAHYAQDDQRWFVVVQDELRTAGVTVRDQQRFVSMVRAQLKSQAKGGTPSHPGLNVVAAGQTPPLIKDVLGPNAPVDDDAVVPAGFRLTKEGIYRLSTTQTARGREGLVAPDPILLTRRLIDSGTGDEHYVITWLRDGAYRDRTVRRVELANKNDLVKLAGKGLPVDSNTASGVVEWLSRYEAANLPIIPVSTVSSHLGWQDREGKAGFLWGNSLITEHGIGAIQGPQITFFGSDEGDKDLADGMRAAGTFVGWQNVVKLAEPYPRVVFVLMAALASPLLHILDVDTFIVDTAGLTSTGKSTVHRLAASVWGQPNPAQPGSMFGSWNASRVYIERRAGLFNGIPVILDDSKQANDQKEVARTIYDLASGQGKGRGSIDGVQRSSHWRTVVLTTGEQRLTDFSQDGGTHGRVLAFWGPPFGPPDTETRKIVNQLVFELDEHFGHAGPAFVAYLLKHRSDWGAWRTEWRTMREHYAEADPNNPIMGRLGAYLAVIALTARLAHDAKILPWPARDPVAPVCDDIRNQAQEADRALQAIREVMGWAVGNYQAFFGRHATDGDANPKMPSQGWIGKWENKEKWDSIAFYPARLDAFLRQQGYDKSIVKIWRDRGWLLVDNKGQRLTKKVRSDAGIGGKTATSWMYVLKRHALEQ